jgi:hypothetical protein
MNENHDQNRFQKLRAKPKQPIPWEQDLNPDRLSGQNTGQQSDSQIHSEWAAYHRRKRGLDPGGVNDQEGD